MEGKEERKVVIYYNLKMKNEIKTNSKSYKNYISHDHLFNYFSFCVFVNLLFQMCERFN